MRDRDLPETEEDAAYASLRRDIIRGARAPSEALEVSRLTELYDCPPATLRLALRRLGQDGLVESETDLGYVVAPLLVEDFEDLNTARTVIEKEALRLSIARGDDAWEAQLVAASYIMRREDLALGAAGAEVPDSWEQANAAFHAALVSACGSGRLLRIRATLHDQVERYRRAAMLRGFDSREVAAEHALISDATLARDADRACALIERHFAVCPAALA